MKRFWETVIGPVLRAMRPKSILEVGSDKGENTANLLAFCEENDAVLHVVDPVPKYDVAEWQERYGERFVFHRALSLDAIPGIARFDFVLLDGDHNWYTVFRELKLLDERSAALSQPFPLVMLHDIGWPFGRRDLYYAPKTIPEAYRQPHAVGGTRPGTDELLEEGGLAGHLEKALHEGGPQNGVLTAVEDFLRETDERPEFLVVPGFHGLGMLVPPHLLENAELAEALKTWRLPPPVARHMEKVERAWLEAEAHRNEQNARLKQNAEELRDRRADLRDTREEMADIRRQLRGVRRRLVDLERRSSAPGGEGGDGVHREEVAGLVEELQLAISRLKPGA